MRLAIMQPYLFPYIGYFQLIRSSDQFVFLDDVSYRKGGFVNRNRIMGANGPEWFTVPLRDISSHRSIRDHITAVRKDKLIRRLEQTYARAPYRKEVSEIVASTLEHDPCSIAVMAEESVRAVCDYVGLSIESARSSEILSDRPGGSDGVIALCERQGAAEYLNLPGGRNLYEPGDFESASLGLSFLEVELTPYSQGGETFEPGLSVIDVLMWNSSAEFREMVERGEIETVVPRRR